MIQLVRITNNWTKRGDRCNIKEVVVLETNDLYAAFRLRLDIHDKRSAASYNAECVNHEVRVDGKQVFLSDLFKLVEGKDEYERILASDNPEDWINCDEWFAKLTAKCG